MGTLPRWLLRHRITIEPYLGRWGIYGAPATGVACQIQRNLGSPTPAGAVRTTTTTIFTQLDTVCPAGSRITLPDGTRGYASSQVIHDAPGLPTPDHQQIAYLAGGEVGPPLGGEQVVILRRVLAGKDRYQNDRYVTEEIVIDTATVRAVSSTERGPASMGAARTQTTDMVEVMFPPGTEITGQDRMRMRGLVYEVEGTPLPQLDPQSGADAGVKVSGKRVTG